MLPITHVLVDRVVCVTGSIQQARPGQITIMVQNRHQGKSNAVFQYVVSICANVYMTAKHRVVDINSLSIV